MLTQQRGLFEVAEQTESEREWSFRGKLSRAGVRGMELEILWGFLRQLLATDEPKTLSEVAALVRLGIPATEKRLNLLVGFNLVSVDDGAGWGRPRFSINNESGMGA